MTGDFRATFGPGKACLGVLHLPALPGSPDFGGDLVPILDRALHESEVLIKAGFDGLMVENYGDIPFLKDRVGPETVAAMTLVASRIKAAVDVPVGINVLRNDWVSSLAIAGACGCEFVRINVLVGAVVTPEGLIEGRPGEVLRMRRQTAPATMILADVKVKHAYPLAAATIKEEAMDAIERGKADGLVITGTRTGSPPSAEDLKAVRIRMEEAGLAPPILVGSGVTPANAEDFLKLSDGLIVGSYIRTGGLAGREVDFQKALEIGRIKKKVGG
jgi:membrane complex biogenesis BtpA family protein